MGAQGLTRSRPADEPGDPLRFLAFDLSGMCFAEQRDVTMMPDHRLSGWLAAGGLLALATATEFLAFTVAAGEDRVNEPSILPILAWLVMPLLLGTASIVGAVCVELLWREVRRPPSLEAEAPEE